MARRLLSPRRMKTKIGLSIIMVATLAASAQAQQAQGSVSRSMSGFPGKDEISAQMGFQASLGGTTPGGFKLFVDYSHRLTNLVWLGVKLKWMTRFHLMPYAGIDAGVVPGFARPGGDNGAAIVLYTGGGLKYFVTPRIGLGGEINFTLGPGLYSGHNEFYRAFNMGIGAEF